MDCKTGFAYDGRSFGGGISAGKFAADFETSVDAIREVDAMVERYANRWSMLCREYNAGTVAPDEFQQRSQELTAKMERLDELHVVLTNAPDAATYQEALRQAYRTAVPEKAVDLGVDLTVTAQRPGEADFSLIGQGASLPTGTRMRFAVNSTIDAHVYIYQVAASGTITPLFPDARIRVPNPVRGAASLTIPPAPASFRLDEHDVGREQVHVVVSASRMHGLESAIEDVTADPSSATAAQLDCHARGLRLEIDDGCPKSRGLVFDGGPRVAEHSLSAVNAAADDAVHLVFHFEHTPR